MYLEFFRLQRPPFAITPDPAFLYLSEQHNESLAHLVYGVTRGGGAGFVQLTGEVGTGKTTLSRLFLQELPAQTHAALILNPNQSPIELLISIFREFGLSTHGTKKQLDALINRLNEHLLKWWEAGESALVLIDEAQNLPRETLEQLRLLTNLETAEQKLLQIILIGQPELKNTMLRKDLRQLSQRITTRYHLQPLNKIETKKYIQHRLSIAANQKQHREPQPPTANSQTLALFSNPAISAIYRFSEGIPRLINVLCDRALLVAYTGESPRVKFRHVQQAISELQPEKKPAIPGFYPVLILAVLALVSIFLFKSYSSYQNKQITSPENAVLVAPSQTTEPIKAPPTTISWQHYFSLWQLDESILWPQSNCPDISLTGMACQQKQGNLKQIETLNTPVMLQLQDQTMLLLLGLSENQALIIDQQGQRLVPRQLINKQWLGSYRILWPIAPELIDDTIANQQRWALSVAQVLSDRPHLTAAQLPSWIKQFQQQNGLLADGIIGSETQMALALKAYDGPQLQHIIENSDVIDN